MTGVHKLDVVDLLGIALDAHGIGYRKAVEPDGRITLQFLPLAAEALIRLIQLPASGPVPLKLAIIETFARAILNVCERGSNPDRSE